MGRLGEERLTVTSRDSSDPRVALRLQSQRPQTAAARAKVRLLEILERTVEYVVGYLNSGDPEPAIKAGRQLEVR
jgi:hypothetical protein